MQADLPERGAQRYHTSDPIENLRIKIRLRQIYEPEPSRTDGAKDRPSSPRFPRQVGRVYSERFHWQEKRFGPHEVIRYQGASAPERLSRAELTYFKFFRKRRVLRDDDSAESGQSAMSSSRLFEDAVPADFAPAMLYTYTDGDNFVAPEETSWRASTSAASKSTLAVAMTYMNRRTSGAFEHHRVPKQAQKIQAALLREEPYKAMYIMAAVEVDAKKAAELVKEQQRRGKRRVVPSMIDFGDELDCHHQVLAQLRLYPSGKLEVYPGLSEDAPESDDDHGGYLDDDACDRAAAVGAKLVTYRFQTGNGRLFEYAIENENEVTNLPDLRKIEQQDIDLRGKQSRSRLQDRSKSLAATGFDQRRPLQLQIRLELRSLDRFAGGTHPMYVEYETQTPSAWRVESDVAPHAAQGVSDGLLQRGEIVGVTQRAVPGVGYGLGMSYDSAAALSAAHAGDMHDARARGVGVAVALVVMMFAALVHGASDLFWLVYALSFGAALQMTHHVCVYPQLGLDASVYHFGHLVAFRLRGSENVRLRSDAHEIARPLPSPKVYFTISRLRAHHVHAVAGYAYADIPQTAGTYDMELDTWKPTDTRYSAMKDFFIGGADRLAHVSFAGREIEGAAQAVGDAASTAQLSDAREEPFLSRLGMVTQSAGKLHLRVVVSEQRPMVSMETYGGHADVQRRSARDALAEFKKRKGEARRRPHEGKYDEQARQDTSSPERGEGKRADIRKELERVRRRREELSAKFKETMERHDSMFPPLLSSSPAAPPTPYSPVPSITRDESVGRTKPSTEA